MAEPLRRAAERSRPASRTEAAEIRKTAAADRCRILYGGSVKPDNIADLIKLPDVDGALIGGASLDVQSFFSIISKVQT